VATTNVTLAGGAPAVVDGVSLAVNDRVLCTGQSTGSQNLIYVVTTVGSGSNGTWTAATDDNTTGELDAGTIVMVTEGLVYADTQWKLITDNPITIGTTSLTWTQNYSANSISSGTSNVSVASNANVTISSAGTLAVLTVSSTGTVVKGTKSVTGNITSGNVLTSGIVSSTGNITGGNILTGGLISVTGNVLTGNILAGAYYYANGVVFSGGGGGGTPGGVNTQIQYNNNGVFGGAAPFTFNNTTNALATTGTFSSTGNITGGNILTSGAISTSSTVTAASTVGGVITGTSVSVSGNITSGNLSVGTGTISGGNIVNTNGNGVGNIGSSTLYFNTVFAKATSAQYADLAEMYCADDKYIPGTVVEFGGKSEITITTQSHSTSVAGIISTNPSYLMNSLIAYKINALEVALVGRVPCLVIGTICKGDRLVSSDLPGVAQALNINLYQPGCIIGKALEEYNSSKPGVIEVAVGRL
jgi:hypothetical protein